MKFFELVCTTLVTKHLTETTNHFQTTGQTERYNRTLVTRLRHLVGEHQDDLDHYVQPLTYGYNMEVHRLTGLTPFDLVLSPDTLNPIIGPPRPALKNNRSNTTARAVKDELFDRLDNMFVPARVNLATAQGRYKRDHDKRVRTILRIRTGDKVFLANRSGRAHADTDRADTLIQLKLSPPASRPHDVIGATDTTASISVISVHETAYLNRVTLLPNASDAPDDASAKDLRVC